LLSFLSKMEIYLTICCEKKKKDKGVMRAIERYNYPRINRIYSKSKEDGINFRILSGKFGLLKIDDKIPWYDNELSEDSFRKLKELVKSQIVKEKISNITFFMRDLRKNPEWKPYFSLIKEVCVELEINLKIELIN